MIDLQVLAEIGFSRRHYDRYQIRRVISEALPCPATTDGKHKWNRHGKTTTGAARQICWKCRTATVAGTAPAQTHGGILIYVQGAGRRKHILTQAHGSETLCGAWYFGKHELTDYSIQKFQPKEDTPVCRWCQRKATTQPGGQA